MMTKRLISALISAAISVPMITPAVLADEPTEVSFDGTADRTGEDIGDISEENAAFSNEGESNDLTNNPVEMNSSDLPDESITDENIVSLKNIADESSEGGDTPVISDALDALSDRLVNGSFEYPFITPEMLDNVNGTSSDARWFSANSNDYQTKYIDGTAYDIDYTGVKFGWKTTAYDTPNATKKTNVIEFVSQKYTGKGSQVYYNGEPLYKKDKTTPVTVTREKKTYAEDNFAADEGVQCSELVGRDQSSLYQNVHTYDGETLQWKLSHRARNYNANANKLDSMALFIGPAYDITNGYADVDYSKPGATNTKQSGSNKGFNTTNKQPNFDMFMWMAQIIFDAAKANNSQLFPTEQSERADSNFDVYNGSLEQDENGHYLPNMHTIYIDPRANDLVGQTKVVKNNPNANNGEVLYTTLFSMKPTETCTQEWKCWIMTDKGTAWGRYAGSYEIPAGQGATTFAFTALSGSESLQEGNLLDGIIFDTQFPLDVKTTAGGTGNVMIEGEDDIAVTPNSPHTQNYWDGTQVTISATPEDDQHIFLGLYEDGVFYDAEHNDLIYDENTNTYTKEIAIDKAKDVQLIFSKKYAVMYDPNGGTFRGDAEPTVIYMSANGGGDTHSSLIAEDTEAAEPLSDDNSTLFSGWYLARAGENGSVLKAGHEIDYVKQENLENALTDIGQTLSDIADSSDDKFIVKFALEASSSDEYEYYACLPAEKGLTFIAEWRYRQRVIAVTKRQADIHYSESTEGGTVNMAITKPDKSVRAENVTEAYGYNADQVTLKATSEDGYSFMGWYDQPNGGKRLSSSDAYTYSIFEPNTVYARFCKALQFPYLCFVSESELNENDQNLAGTNFAWGSHITNGKTNDQKLLISGLGGDTNYGSTISTGFIANTVFSSDITTQYCTWKIIIPCNEGNDLFIKVPDGENVVWQEESESSETENDGETEETSYLGTYGVKFDDTPLFTDSEAVHSNKGSIHKVSSIENESGNITLKFIDQLPVKITGAAIVTYGLIIDNIYAPGAEAFIEYPESKDSITETDFLDITSGSDREADGELTHSKTFDYYINHSGYGTAR